MRNKIKLKANARGLFHSKIGSTGLRKHKKQMKANRSSWKTRTRGSQIIFCHLLALKQMANRC